MSRACRITFTIMVNTTGIIVTIMVNTTISSCRSYGQSQG